MLFIVNVENCAGPRGIGSIQRPFLRGAECRDKKSCNTAALHITGNVQSAIEESERMQFVIVILCCDI